MSDASLQRVVELWDDLPPSAQKKLPRILERLADGFSGVLELRCHQGGIADVREELLWGRDLTVDRKAP